ncbi:MAG: S8 family serine peptidase [Bacteroidota bacterium]|nr:S8 family serine peptidase [Bacteroidota bacterium]
MKSHPTYDGRGTIIAILDDGVDPGIAGLLQTSEGKKKIIDVQDFAGTGDLYWQPAERSGDKVIVNGKSVLTGLDKVAIQSYDGKYFFASLAESKFQNGLGDLNFNDKKNDNFGVLIFQDSKDHWLAIVDGDADGSLADETVLSNYKENQNVFHFRAAKDESDNDGRFLTGAVNIFPEEKRINLYFADGGHGTHVAGIAGGNRIDGQTGFNGVAPGAEMIALKFADNTMDGVTVSGSMKRAYLYVVKIAQETGKPVIVNMSFGIGSEIEGHSVMDQWLDSLLDAHPEITVCISAGNDGPGLSNIGLPGSARTVITSGAGLPDDTGRDLYGLKMSRPVVWDFSSRGGELAKPDIVSPGTAISTVPDYVMGDRYNGTSMSSPYTSGCCAILISGMKQMFPDYRPNSNEIKRALQAGATPLANMTLLDQGSGMVNVPNAFEYLAEWHRKNIHPRQYLISVAVPNSVRKGSAAYYRTGLYPKNGDRTMFNILPLESSSSSSKSREKMLSFNAYELRSTATWLEPVQSSIYRRGEGSFQVLVNYDSKQLQKPGVYCAKILGYPKGASVNSVPEFELWNTVVIPHVLSQENSFKSEVKDIKVHSGRLDREFFTIPAGTKAVKVSLSSRDLKSNVDAIIINNDGRTFSRVHLSPGDNDESSRIITGDDLQHGVWEIDVKRGLASDDEAESSVDLNVTATPFDVRPEWLSLPSKGTASGRIEITNSSASELSLESGHIDVEGYQRYIDTIISEGDTYLYRFKAHPGEGAISFSCSLSREDYDLFTDIAFQILRPDQSAAVNAGFDLRDAKIRLEFAKNDSLTYTLKFRGGLADPAKPSPFRLVIRECRELESKNRYESLECMVSPSSKFLNPSQSEYFLVSSKDQIPELPDDYVFYGDLAFRLGPDNIKVPVTFSP